MELNVKSFNRLFKKTSTGAIQYWDIFVYEDSDHSTGHIIKTEYGQVGTENPQATFDAIYEGKNIGKANETSVREQAEAEAKSRWEKKKKSGYVEYQTAAEAGETDDLIQGGIVPMLAHTFEKQGHKIKYPCYVQPKLDGIRCIAILKDGKCKLFSRTRKAINSCPHIIAEIERMFVGDIILDGELYNSDFKNDFEKIVSAVRKDGPEEGYLNVQYHIYDLVDDQTFEKRSQKIKNCFTIGSPVFTYLKRVETMYVVDETDALCECMGYKRNGFEGGMIRNSAGLYQNKRSSDLIKVKEFEDSEFKIIGIEEGRGKLSGHVGAFICVNESGQEFKAKMSGETSNLKKYFEDHSLWSGKLLTVQYQGLTGANGVPRFPVGLRIRAEDV